MRLFRERVKLFVYVLTCVDVILESRSFTSITADDYEPLSYNFGHFYARLVSAATAV